MRASLLAPALLALAAACSPQATATAPASTPAAGVAVHPVSGLQVIPLTAQLAGGSHAFKVELAASADEQERGLMFRTAMGADEGMLFPYNPPRPVSFWMKNTVLSLDIIFIGADHKVLNIAASTTPYSERNLWSQGAAIAVLELNAGRAKALGIAPGTRIDW